MTPAPRRTALRAAAAVASVLLIAAVPLWRQGPRYGFVTSSASPGYDMTGTLGESAAYGVLFHTQNELDPWVEIDLGEERPVHAVEITNRYDCCQERAVPLLLELAGETRDFGEVGRIDAPFERATLEPAGAPSARYVRLQVRGRTMFHLAEVRVR